MIPISTKFLTYSRQDPDESIIDQPIIDWVKEQNIAMAIRVKVQDDFDSDPKISYILIENFTGELYSQVFDEKLYFFNPDDELLFKLTWC